MRFLVDAQLPPRLCEWLRMQGHVAVHVMDRAMTGASDRVIADLAIAEDFVLVSKDEDFLILRLPDRFVLVWLRIGNATNAALTAWIEKRWMAIETALAAGERLVEVR